LRVLRHYDIVKRDTGLSFIVISILVKFRSPHCTCIAGSLSLFTGVHEQLMAQFWTDRWICITLSYATICNATVTAVVRLQGVKVLSLI